MRLKSRGFVVIAFLTNACYGNFIYLFIHYLVSIDTRAILHKPFCERRKNRDEMWNLILDTFMAIYEKRNLILLCNFFLFVLFSLRFNSFQRESVSTLFNYPRSTIQSTVLCACCMCLCVMRHQTTVLHTISRRTS